MDGPAGPMREGRPTGGAGDDAVGLLVAAPEREHDLLDVLLSPMPFAATFVATADAALAHLKGATPAAALIALDLPDLAGDEIARRLREVPRLTRTAVVLYGDGEGEAGLSEDAHARAREAGADLLLPRPLAGKDLAARLYALAGGTPPAADAPSDGEAANPAAQDPASLARALRAAEARVAELHARIAELERRNAALLDALDEAGDAGGSPALGRRGRTRR